LWQPCEKLVARHALIRKRDRFRKHIGVNLARCAREIRYCD
jgi:hypothetical protein